MQHHFASHPSHAATRRSMASAYAPFWCLCVASIVAKALCPIALRLSHSFLEWLIVYPRRLSRVSAQIEDLSLDPPSDVCRGGSLTAHLMQRTAVKVQSVWNRSSSSALRWRFGCRVRSTQFVHLDIRLTTLQYSFLRSPNTRSKFSNFVFLTDRHI